MADGQVSFPPRTAGVLRLNKVEISKSETANDKPIQLTSEKGKENYFDAEDVFGDIGNKNKAPMESSLKKLTQSTPEVEKIVVDLEADTSNPTARDLKAQDIIGKEAGASGRDFAKTEAFQAFLAANEGDFELKDYEYKGEKEQSYFLSENSDKKLNMFSSELINGQEYLAIRDKEGKIRYFNPKDEYKECTPNTASIENKQPTIAEKKEQTQKPNSNINKQEIDKSTNNIPIRQMFTAFPRIKARRAARLQMRNPQFKATVNSNIQPKAYNVYSGFLGIVKRAVQEY